VVGAVTIDLARAALRRRREIAIAAACALLLATRLVSEPVLAAAAVAIGAIQGSLAERPPRDAPPPPPSAPGSFAFAFPIVVGGSLGALAGLVRVFVPIGITTFGGGLAMIPAIEHMVVIEQGWIDATAFADAIALGQLTPGPIAICATFIGYRVAGLLGSLVATLAMFAPPTALALVAGRSVERFRTSPAIHGALRLLAPAVIGMLAAATLSLGRAAFGAPVDVALAAVGFLVLLLRPISPIWVLVGGGLARLAFFHLVHA
jgi:chromate transporter